MSPVWEWHKDNSLASNCVREWRICILVFVSSGIYSIYIYNTTPQKEDIILLYIGYHNITKLNTTRLNREPGREGGVGPREAGTGSLCGIPLNSQAWSKARFAAVNSMYRCAVARERCVWVRVPKM